MERLSERLTALDAIIRKLEPVESFLERVELLEKNIYATKKVFTFSEACMYIGVSESMPVSYTHLYVRQPLPPSDSSVLAR